MSAVFFYINIKLSFDLKEYFQVVFTNNLHKRRDIQFKFQPTKNKGVINEVY